MNHRNNNQSTGRDNTSEDVGYFDLHTKGCGYLSRIRLVTPRGGTPFLACAISALYGKCDDPSYAYFDLKVTGAEARSLVEGLQEDVDQDRKVFVAFRVGDGYADAYMADEKDPKTGRPTGRQIPRASIKGRLLLITHVQVDGKVVYQRPDRDEAEGLDKGPGHEGDDLNDDGVGSAQADDSQPAQRSGRPAQDARPVVAPQRSGQRQATNPRGRSVSYA